MDMAFLLRAQRMLGERDAAPIDYGLLVATLAAHQSATVTAKLAERRRMDALASRSPAEPIAEIILGGPEWRQAAAAQQGCFNRTIARARGA